MCRYRCSACGFIAHVPAAFAQSDAWKRHIDFSCGKIPARGDEKSPGIVRRATNYGRAVARWKKAGSPVRSDREVEAILAICRRCEHYTQRQTCRKCGCHINRSPKAYLNKLRMATEACPIGKWKAKVEVR